MIEQKHLGNLLSPKRWLMRIVFWSGALMVGMVGVLFVWGARLGHQLFDWILSVSPWLPFFVMPSGLAFCTWLSLRFFPGSQGSGIPQSIAALRREDQEQLKGLLSLRIVFGKIIVTILGLCSGASVGPEGPMVQIGASITYSLRRFSPFTYRDELGGLIVAGGAAGIAAAFNTPLAGIAFAIEELSRSFTQRTNGLVLTAIIFAGLATHAVLGNYTYFGSVSTSIGPGVGWLAVIACGIAGGLAGGLFSRILIGASGIRGKFAGRWIRAHPFAFAGACGIVLAGLGVVSGHHTYGTGYGEVRDIIAHGDANYPAYGLWKFLATLASALSGIPGGIFAPSLAVGAGFGSMIAHVIPSVPAATVIVLGMVAYFSGVTQAPLTTFTIVMEMTDNHHIVLPLIAASLIAHGISQIVCPQSLYKSLAGHFGPRTGK
jgi:chloride channel protein, CIC family